MTEKQGAPDFKGVNSFRLNTATMNEIVAFWLAHKWVGEQPKINVCWNSNQQVFDVNLVSDETVK